MQNFLAFSILGLGTLLAQVAGEWKEEPESVQNLETILYRSLPGVFEPSGVVQLPDSNRILFVDDSRHGALFELQLDGAGELQSGPLRRELGLEPPARDLEGLTIAGASGALYAIASHSPTSNGRKEYLLEVRATSLDDLEVTGSVRGLAGELRRRYPEIRKVAGKSEEKGGLNIEAIAVHPTRQEILIGIRTPLAGRKNRALLLPLKIRDQQAPMSLENFEFPPKLMRLDLKGGGIRGMEFDPLHQTVLIIAAKKDRFRLWRWSGDPDEAPERLKKVKFKKGSKPEGIARIRMADGSQPLLLVDDDGGYWIVPEGFLLED